MGIPIHIGKDEIRQFAKDQLLKVFPTQELIIMPLKAKDIVNGLIVADNLYTEFKWPKDEVKMTTKFVPHLMVQDLISVTYKTQRYEGDALYGYAIWDTDNYGERFGYNINRNITAYCSL